MGGAGSSGREPRTIAASRPRADRRSRAGARGPSRARGGRRGAPRLEPSPCGSGRSRGAPPRGAACAPRGRPLPGRPRSRPRRRTPDPLEEGRERRVHTLEVVRGRGPRPATRGARAGSSGDERWSLRAWPSTGRARHEVGEGRDPRLPEQVVRRLHAGALDRLGHLDGEPVDRALLERDEERRLGGEVAIERPDGAVELDREPLDRQLIEAVAQEKRHGRVEDLVASGLAPPGPTHTAGRRLRVTGRAGLPGHGCIVNAVHSLVKIVWMPRLRQDGACCSNSEGGLCARPRRAGGFFVVANVVRIVNNVRVARRASCTILSFEAEWSSTGPVPRRVPPTWPSTAARSWRSATSRPRPRGDRRARAARHPRLRRRAHALRRPGHVGPAAHAVVVARRDHRRHGQLRGRVRAGAPRRREWLIQLMEGVEDIPGAALVEGIRWGWETFPEYLDARSSDARTRSTSAPRSRTGPSAPTSWTSAEPPTSPRPRPT